MRKNIFLAEDYHSETSSISFVTILRFVLAGCLPGQCFSANDGAPDAATLPAAAVSPTEAPTTAPASEPTAAPAADADSGSDEAILALPDEIVTQLDAFMRVPSVA